MQPTKWSVPSTWSFECGSETLVVVRRELPRGYELVMRHSSDGEQVIRFADLVDLVAFHVDLETRLVAQGWTFVRFEPDRSRRGRRRDDRGTAADRRRTPAGKGARRR